MTQRKCPSCEKGKIRIEIIPEYETKLRGMPFVVKDAKIAKCDICGEELYNAKEIKRWEELLKKTLQAQNLLITPYEVKTLREDMGLSVADFSSIFGVTRQTVYGWESEKTSGVQLGPASLLLGLLGEEKSGSLTGIYDFLFASARNRGQEVKSYQMETKEDSKPSDNKDYAEAARCLVRFRPSVAPGFGPVVSVL